MRLINPNPLLSPATSREEARENRRVLSTLAVAICCTAPLMVYDMITGPAKTKTKPHIDT